jgi:5-formyltetrahydrofolate cyclo-ligase
MNKETLRKIYLQKRLSLSTKELVRLDSLILIRFQQLSLGNIQSLLSYWPVNDKAEVNTHLMVDFLFFQVPGLQLSFPVIDQQEFVFKPVSVDDDTMYVPNRFGIPEPASGMEIDPEDLDLVFVPLLAFDTNGFRAGYGKGYYDRFLKKCRKDALKIGFSYFEPEPSIDDINEYDVPLNICITPNNTYEF